MSVDLQQSLEQLARSVHDDGASERITGQVQHMVTRIRRRRAARQAATGVVSVGAVAAVALGGVQLAGRDVVAPVATEGAADVRSDDALACGALAPDVMVPTDGPTAGWRLDADVQTEVAPGGTLQVDVRLLDEDAQLVTWDQTTPQTLTVAVVQDGRVVSSTLIGLADSRPGVSPQDYVIFSGALAQTSCGTSGGTLAPGEYSIIAAQTLRHAGVDAVTPLRVMGGPWRFTVVDTPASTPTADPGSGDAEASRDLVAAEAMLEAHLAAPSSDTFPACRSAVVSRTGDVLALDLALEARPYARAERIDGEVTVRTVDGRGVIGQAPTTGARLILTRGGMVVGSTYSDPEDVDLLDLGPQDTAAVPLYGSMSLCAEPLTDAAQPGLPPGTYEAYAVMEVMLQEVTEASGEATAVTELVLAVSEPVMVTVE